MGGSAPRCAWLCVLVVGAQGRSFADEDDPKRSRPPDDDDPKRSRLESSGRRRSKRSSFHPRIDDPKVFRDTEARELHAFRVLERRRDFDRAAARELFEEWRVSDDDKRRVMAPALLAVPGARIHAPRLYLDILAGSPDDDQLERACRRAAHYASRDGESRADFDLLMDECWDALKASYRPGVLEVYRARAGFPIAPSGIDLRTITAEDDPWAVATVIARLIERRPTLADRWLASYFERSEDLRHFKDPDGQAPLIDHMNALAEGGYHRSEQAYAVAEGEGAGDGLLIAGISVGSAGLVIGALELALVRGGGYRLATDRGTAGAAVVAGSLVLSGLILVLASIPAHARAHAAREQAEANESGPSPAF